ncbi:MAG: SDR family NAD(P)-dependent oxidoreductase, partial [Planctomycetota bacterium]|nr:SDR family NAD(P)-dependent oxidoreductase [Planctomycetota bacterium]
IAQEKPFLELTDEDWERMFSVNLLGAVRCVREVLPAMRAARFGRIVNVSSIGGQWGGTNQVHYAASKAALISLTRSLAKLASGDGVTCNAIAPGLVATGMSAPELATDAGREKLRGIPAGRLGTVDEVGAAVAWLSSDGAAYVTGQTLNLNGGMYLG